MLSSSIDTVSLTDRQHFPLRPSSLFVLVDSHCASLVVGQRPELHDGTHTVFSGATS